MVEGTISINSVLLNIVDTAGIRETTDLIEKIGVDKSLNLIENSDLIILVLNNNEELQKEDLDLLERTKNKNRIIVINKIDLKQKIDKSKLDGDVVEVSTINNNISSLKEKIIEKFNLNEIDKKDPNYLFNTRQISIFKQTLSNINDIKKELKKVYQ